MSVLEEFLPNRAGATHDLVEGDHEVDLVALQDILQSGEAHREGVGESLRAEDERADLCRLGSSDHSVELGDRPRLLQARPSEIRMTWAKLPSGGRVPVAAGHRLAEEGAKMCLYRCGAGLV